MLPFILLLGFLSVLFTIALELYDSSGYKAVATQNISKKIVIVLIGFIFFGLVFYLQKFLFLLIIIGVFFIILSFVYLGIITFSFLKNEAHFLNHMLLISTISAISGVELLSAVWGLVFFILLYLFVQYGFKYFPVKSRENVNELLELFRVISGIFIFIIGLVIASDRIRFLKKFADILF